MSHAKHRRQRLFHYEHRLEKLAPLPVFRARLAQSAGITGVVIAFSLAIGIAGYHWLGRLDSWVDCLYNASMILGGMGPVAELHTDAGKVFASLYALYSGIVLLASVGVLLSPVLHRLLHRFHIENAQDARDSEQGGE
jgi:hypothetical protein